MVVTVSDTYELMCRVVMEDLFLRMAKRPDPLLCTASGDTPTGLYREMVSRGVPPFWKFVGLDEWVGMDATDDGSCRHYADQNLFGPAAISPDRIHFFNGKSPHLEQECADTENCIQRWGGIDVAILGIGMNGHVGLNEPGVSPNLRAHVMSIHPVTQQTGQKYFPGHRQLKKGITLGIASLLACRYPLLMASGAHKASIVQQVLEGDITEQVPSSLLRRHDDLHVYLDKTAASLLHIYG